MANRASIIALVLFPITACNDQRFAVRPGDVKSIDGGQVLQGDFEIAIANPAEDSVLSLFGMGGACLITQDTRAVTLCEDDPECQPEYRDVDGTVHSPGPFSHGYCLSYHNLPSVKTCWIKPSQDHCRIPVIPGNYKTSYTNQEEALAWFGAGSKLSWRVLVCVNGNDDESKDDAHDLAVGVPCKEDHPQPGERLERAGKEYPEIWQVPNVRRAPPSRPLCPPPGIRGPEGCP